MTASHGNIAYTVQCLLHLALTSSLLQLLSRQADDEVFNIGTVKFYDPLPAQLIGVKPRSKMLQKEGFTQMIRNVLP